MFNDELGKAELTSSENHGGATHYRWLAHELHDGLLQWVVGARMQVEAAVAKLGNDSAAVTNLEQAIVHLLNALAEGRELIGFLDRQEVGECDLDSSIAKFLEAMQPLVEQRGQSLQFESQHAEPSHEESQLTNLPAISRQTAWSVLRFVQQAVQNAIQHAGPASVCVRLKWNIEVDDEGTLHVSVEDNGRGFDPKVELPAGHFGLQSLQQRANMCGGVFTLRTAPVAGCYVSLDVPLCKENEAS